MFVFSPMRWTSEHDILLLREVLLYEPYKHRKGSVERGKVWDLLAESLNKIKTTSFRVTGRSVRDHLKALLDNFKRKESEEERASGINPDESEADIALRDIMERFNEAEQESQQAAEKRLKNDDVQKAIEMRKRSMETFAETKDRTDETPVKRTRNNGSDTISYLKEKSQMEMEIREKELKVKEDERKEQKETMATLVSQQQAMLQHLTEQQNANVMCIQQQMQQQQQQMQQQQNLFLALFQTLQKKD